MSGGTNVGRTNVGGTCVCGTKVAPPLLSVDLNFSVCVSLKLFVAILKVQVGQKWPVGRGWTTLNI
jgi:hypothetical protein